MTNAKAPPTPALDLPPGPWTPAQALAVCAQYQDAAAPPAAVVQGWNAALTAHPGLWRLTGDLAWQARAHLLATYMPRPLIRAAMEHGADGLAADLGRATAPPLEQLLIDQVVICWMHLYALEQGYTNVHTGEFSLPVSEHWERRMNAAQRRYLRACETLARVRRLSAVQPLQVNIGGQQVNVAGG